MRQTQRKPRCHVSEDRFLLHQKALRDWRKQEEVWQTQRQHTLQQRVTSFIQLYSVRGSDSIVRRKLEAGSKTLIKCFNRRKNN